MGDDGAGSESTLIRLYRDVPAAEEFDLVERARLDQEQRRHDAWLAEQEPPEDDEPVPEDDADDGPDPLSPNQTIGMIEHLLEAEVIDEDDGDS